MTFLTCLERFGIFRGDDIGMTSCLDPLFEVTLLFDVEKYGFGAQKGDIENKVR